MNNEQWKKNWLNSKKTDKFTISDFAVYGGFFVTLIFTLIRAYNIKDTENQLGFICIFLFILSSSFVVTVFFLFIAENQPNRYYNETDIKNPEMEGK